MSDSSADYSGGEEDINVAFGRGVIRTCSFFSFERDRFASCGKILRRKRPSAQVVFYLTIIVAVLACEFESTRPLLMLSTQKTIRKVL